LTRFNVAAGNRIKAERVDKKLGIFFIRKNEDKREEKSKKEGRCLREERDSRESANSVFRTINRSKGYFKT